MKIVLPGKLVSKNIMASNSKKKSLGLGNLGCSLGQNTTYTPHSKMVVAGSVNVNSGRPCANRFPLKEIFTPKKKRTPKHKIANRKCRVKLNFDDIGIEANKRIHNLNYDCKVNLNDVLLKDQRDKTYMDKAQMKRIMFAPVDESLKDKAIGSSGFPKITSSNSVTCCGDGKSKSIFKCKSILCGIRKETFLPADRVVSSTTLRMYDVITPPGTSYIDCMSKNLIYLITCDNCSIQYVGETVRGLNFRIREHQKGIRYPENNYGCRLLTQHFTNGLCKNARFSVKIIEKIEGDGRDENGKPDFEVRRRRHAREKHWMLKLRTVYPFGLNDKVGDEGKCSNDIKLITRKFPKLDRSCKRHTKGNHKSNNNNNITAEVFLENMKNILNNDVKEAMNYIRKNLNHLKKNVLKRIATLTEDYTLEVNNLHVHWYLALHDMIASKLYVEPQVKLKKPRPKTTIKIKFVNKGIELINLPNILHDKLLLSTFPNHLAGIYEPPTVIYTLTDTIHSSLFNFNKFVKDINLDAFNINNSLLPCECNNSDHKNPHHNHIVSGDVQNLVTNTKLRALFLKGPKYREPVTINLKNAKDAITTSIDQLIKHWSDTKKIDTVIFNDWKHTLFEILDKRILDVNNKSNFKKFKPLLEQKSIKASLKELHERFVICPIDKAASNVAIVCKRFYATVLSKELDLIKSNNLPVNPTYLSITQPLLDEIIAKQKIELNEFGIPVSDENEGLPNMYWTPKMHKIPSKARFIVAAKCCTIKPLAKCITAILKRFQTQISNYCASSKSFTHINSFWVVQNKQPVISAMDNLNLKNKAKRISTYDFSTLYTKIPHDKLKQVMNELTDFCFKGCPDSKLIVNMKSIEAYWRKSHSKDEIPFGKQLVKDCIAYLLDNCYFIVGKQIFKQIIGIPMGSDPAPFMANLFLYYYESQFIKKYQKENNKGVYKFGNIFRFIDDLNAINDNGEFEKNIKNIYPEELELKKENVGINDATFLDLGIEIKNKKFTYKLYDKRDDFGFPIVRMPYLSNNMPSRIFYSTYMSELLRIAKCSSGKNEFEESAFKLMKRMWDQGTEFIKTKKALKNLYTNHLSTLNKFYETSRSFCKVLLFGVPD